MKKREITKIVHSLMVAGLAACLLTGCGNAKTESSSDAAVEETTDAEAANESETAESEASEEQSDASTETLAEENSSTETTDTDTTDSSDEAEETESDTVSDPGEVTYITDFTSIDDYMGSLDSEKPAIVIYNQQEGYLINMQEGQHYQLKAEDKILFNFESSVGYGYDHDLGSSFEPRNGYVVYLADYSKISEDKDFYLRKKLEDGSIVGVSCYLAPPVEQ